MTKETILKKTFERADKNGCKNLPFGISWADNSEYFELEEWAKIYIFSHDFAKAFWGEETFFNGYKFQYTNKQHIEDFKYALEYSNDLDRLTDILEDEEIKLPTWQYHLQQMVLEEEPIKYLEQFLNDKIYEN